MATSLRTLARESFLALLVSYLRDGVTTIGSFSMVAGVGGKYPFTQGVWTFSLNSELWQITQVEATQDPLPVGVTIQFADDIPADSKAMPQIWRTRARIIVRTPRDWQGESTAQEIATKIDQALHRTAGRIEITDYDVNPAVGQGTFLTWQRTERAQWETQGDNTIEELRGEQEMEYATASL